MESLSHDVSGLVSLGARDAREGGPCFHVVYIPRASEGSQVPEEELREVQVRSGQ